jgi:hypothetical protein
MPPGVQWPKFPDFNDPIPMGPYGFFVGAKFSLIFGIFFVILKYKGYIVCWTSNAKYKQMHAISIFNKKSTWS